MTATSSNNPSLAILHRMASILDQVTKVSYNLSGLAMASMLCLVINEVVMRYFFNAPTTWSSDANQWLFALTVMLALPEITRVNGNVAITVILERMPRRRREIFGRILAIISFMACLLAFYISGTETLRQLCNGITTTWVRPIPKWWISVVIPFGFLLSSIQFLRLGLKPAPQIEE
ncbi:MAG: TRAP transporter small permease [Desulfuromonadaceae bacterium]|nr:TRAP transporter small permease [Desulfuromonadaceae bacterium]